VSESYAEYLNDIERFFTLIRMSGFILAPRDAERVRQWYLRGIPLQVVLDGLVEGARAWQYKAGPNEHLPHNLSYFSHKIGARVRTYRRTPERLKQLPEEPSAENPVSEMVTHLCSEMNVLSLNEERPLEKEIKQTYVLQLEELGNNPDTLHDELSLNYELQVLDGEMLALYHSRLDVDEKLQVDKEVAALLAREQGLSQQALTGRRRILLARLLRERLRIMTLVQ
jgi:hypothetical protein